jgi:hypothetical protein
VALRGILCQLLILCRRHFDFDFYPSSSRVPLKSLRPKARSVVDTQYLDDISLQLIGDNE